MLLVRHTLGGGYPNHRRDRRVDRHNLHEYVLIFGYAAGCRHLHGGREGPGIGADHGMRIGAAGKPRESIVHVRVHHTNRGATARPVHDVAMRAVPGRPEKSGGPAPCQESVAAETVGEPRGLLNRDAGLRADGDGAVVEETVSYTHLR